MIAKFPLFQKLSLSHLSLINKFVKNFPPYSDFNFTSMWTYNTKNSLEISFLNRNLVVMFNDYLDQSRFFSFIGENEVVKTTKTLLDHAAKKNISNRLKLVPEVVVKANKDLSHHFEVAEDIDNHDYIVSTEEIAVLHPEKYKRKRYQVERFKRKYPQYKIERLNLKDKRIQKQIKDLFILWEKKAGRDRAETENELKALTRLFRLCDYLTIYGTGIFLKNRLVAFNIYELTHNRYGMSSFQKADRSLTYIYSTLTHEAAKHLHQLRCRYINYEQDLGIEGLRLSKSLWKPVHYLKKYIIYPRPVVPSFVTDKQPVLNNRSVGW